MTYDIVRAINNCISSNNIFSRIELIDIETTY